MSVELTDSVLLARRPSRRRTLALSTVHTCTEILMLRSVYVYKQCGEQ